MKKVGVIVILLIIIGVVVAKEYFKEEEKEVESKYSTKLTKLINKKRTYSDDLIEIRYSNSGDMCGNVYVISLDIEEKIMKQESKECYYEPLKVIEYRVTDKDIKKLNDYIKEYNFPMWKDLEQTEYVLDAPTRSITFTYNNKDGLKSYTIYYLADMPKDGRKALDEFTSYYTGLANDDNFIKEYIEEE